MSKIEKIQDYFLLRHNVPLNKVTHVHNYICMHVDQQKVTPISLQQQNYPYIYLCKYILIQTQYI